MCFSVRLQFPFSNQYIAIKLPNCTMLFYYNKLIIKPIDTHVLLWDVYEINAFFNIIGRVYWACAEKCLGYELM